MAGAANRTIGNINSQASSQDRSQCKTNEPVVRSGRLAIAAARAHVKQD
jgi:hypothetical protein